MNLSADHNVKMPYMPSTVEQIQLKVARAKIHLRELEGISARFMNAKPYAVGTKRNAEKRLVYFVSRIVEVPPEIPVVAGDVLQNLRSALDHIAYRLVLSGAGSMPTQHVYFPIALDLQRYNEKKTRDLRGASPAVINAVDAVKPYRGGTDALWRLHKLNNIDKHRLLLTVGSAFHSFDVAAVMQKHFEDLARSSGGIHVQLPPFFFSPSDRMFPLKSGTELFLDLPDAVPNDRIQFRFDIALQESEAGVNGEPLIETLNDIVKAVEATVNQLAPLV